MNKKLALTALFAAALFAAGYLAWTTWISPRPAVTAQVQPGPTAAPAITPNPTIVTASVNKDGIPEQLGSLRLAGSEIGKDALAEFESLHNEDFKLLGGYKAVYGAAGKQATLWVGLAKDSATAQGLVSQMALKIGAGNEAFTDLGELSIQGRTLYQVYSQDQVNFFYAANDKVIWLAATPDYAPDALHSLWGAVK